MMNDSSWQTVLLQAEEALAAQRWREARAGAQRVLAGGTDAGLRARAAVLAARSAWHLADLASAAAEALQALTLAREAGHVPTEVSALTLAAFALTELNCAEPALDLALRALEQTQADALYELKPVALSCAAHVQARLGHLVAAESLHMQALSMARETGSPERLQMAYDNLSLSLSYVHRKARQSQDRGLAEVATLYARKHLPQIRCLLGDERLDGWRRLSLMHSLGELLALSGAADELEEAEALLRDGLTQALALQAEYSLLGAQTALAELLAGRGLHHEALALLDPTLRSARLGEIGHQRQQVLELLLACCRALGLDQRSDELSGQMQAAAQGLAQARARLMQHPALSAKT